MKISKIELLLLFVFLWNLTILEASNDVFNPAIIMNQETEEQYLYIEISGEKGAKVEVRLNDIPASELIIEGENGSGNSFTNVKYYTKPGINTLSVYSLSEKGKAIVRLVRYLKGQTTGRGEGETLAEIIVENTKSPIHKEIKLPSKNERWSWVDADAITDEKIELEAMGFVKRFYKIMGKSNVDKMIEALDPIINDELRSKPNMTKEKLVQDWTKFMKMAFNSENTYDDINKISIQLTPVANGKLFEVKRKDGSLVFRTSDNSVGFKKIIGRKDGVWKFYF